MLIYFLLVSGLTEFNKKYGLCILPAHVLWFGSQGFFIKIYTKISGEKPTSGDRQSIAHLVTR
ncbi:hypothetical protein [Gloeocapsopsis sp. IPPAS B-1203]|uniref:hypothetical protein n=1 Tax=Gloeocapsopsis sp. IPPAS B-1203 TaxID=2049454 RepID=UPI000C195461|nr:hypothetical protein [Gloeocapsopsis sp. IPPAS B-1203]